MSVLVYLEHAGGAVDEPSLQALTLARAYAGGGEVDAVVACVEATQALSAALAGHGVGTLHVAEDGAYGAYGASRSLDYPCNDQWDRPDRGHDLQEEVYPSIQVKSTATYYRGEHYIFFRKADRFISDIVLQAHVEGRTISLVGWASRRRFWHTHEMKDFGAGHGLQPALHERFWGSMLAFPVMPVRLEGCPEAE